jgi:hypothetical protein
MDSRVVIGNLEDGLLRTRWDRLVNDCADASPFSRLEVIEAQAAAYNLKTHLVLVADGARDVAGAILFSRRRIGLRIIDVPPLTPYSAILVRSDDDDDRLPSIGSLARAASGMAEVVHLEMPPGLKALGVLAENGYRSRARFTFTARLDPEATFALRWSESALRLARKYADRYVISKEGPEAIEDLLNHVTRAYSASGKSLPGSTSGHQVVIRAALDAGIARLYTARDDGGALSASVAVTCSGQSAYYWVAGSEPGPAMSVLLHEILGRLEREGFRSFDFIGANTGTIAEFKRRRSDALIPYYRCSIARNRLVGLATTLTGRL